MMKGLATLVAVAMVFGPREGDAFAPAARFARAAAPRVAAGASSGTTTLHARRSASSK